MASPGPVLMRAWDDMPSLRHLLDVGVDPKESLQTFTSRYPFSSWRRVTDSSRRRGRSWKKAWIRDSSGLVVPPP